jgi:GxxExxY protein
MAQEFVPISPEIEAIAAQIVDAAIKIHRMLGPGLLESVYEQCLAHELTMRGFHVQRQLPVPIVYEQLKLEVGFRLDLLVNDSIIVECKAVKELCAIDRQQTLTHLRMANKRLGFLINFNVTRLKDGLARIIN